MNLIVKENSLLCFVFLENALWKAVDYCHNIDIAVSLEGAEDVYPWLRGSVERKSVWSGGILTLDLTLGIARYPVVHTCFGLHETPSADGETTGDIIFISVNPVTG